MYDFLGTYKRLNHIYRMYIESAFPLRYDVLNQERRLLLEEPGVLSQLPLLETLPVYPSSGLNLKEASERLPAEYGNLSNIANDLMPNGMQLYKHQWQALQEVLINGRDIVITTGTGSGKTECFLLPILAELAKDSNDWPECPPAPQNHKWWHNLQENCERIGQFSHTGRSLKGFHAVRAMILYPLNALVEDQLRRLRNTLDSPRCHEWLDKQRKGNRVLFGRYTGLTPVSGRPDNSSAVKRLAHHLQVLESECVKIAELEESARYYFPDINGGEMWSRWDMQETPPDILITNYSMLNIMLMRQIEEPIFEQTKNWLAQDKNNKFFLVIDELHSYRGTPGTEVAYILRLLINRLGLDINSEQLVILATSASIDESAESREFLKQFFGRDRFVVISGEEVLPDASSVERVRAMADHWAAFRHHVQQNNNKTMLPPDPNTLEIQEAMKQLASALGSKGQPNDSVQVTLGQVLVRIGVPDALRQGCIMVHKSVRPTQINDLDKVLFPGQKRNDIVSDALIGLLWATAMSTNSESGVSPQPIRGHLFFHNMQNIWACSNPRCTHKFCQIDQRKKLLGTDREIPIGSLHANHRLTCTCGGRILDLVVCEVCGEVFLGGYRVSKKIGRAQFDVLTCDQPDLEKMPDQTSAKKTYQKYALFWPLGTQSCTKIKPEDEEYQLNHIKRRWKPARFNVFSGVLSQDCSPPGNNEISGWLYVIAGDNPDESAMPVKCPRCGSDYRSKLVNSPLRNHRTGFQKACQVLAGALYREMSPMHSSPKLVIFSDSRQDAAKLAAGMEQDHFRDMIRLALLQALNSYWYEFAAFFRFMVGYNPQLAAKIAEINPKLYDEVRQPQKEDDMRLRTRFQQAHPLLMAEIMNWSCGAPPVNQEEYDELIKMLRTYPGRIRFLELMSVVKEIMLRLGMNPGGCEHRVNTYYVPDGNNRELHSWYECYNWLDTGPQRKQGLRIEAERLLGMIDNCLFEEIMYAIFPHVARTFESMGMGWVTYDEKPDTDNTIVQATNAVIRLLGERKTHRYQRGFLPGDEFKLPRYAANYLSIAGGSEDKVIEELRHSKAGLPGMSSLGLDPDYLYMISTSYEGKESGWICPSCNAFYLHPAAGYCPECASIKQKHKLITGKPTSQLDYYLYLASQSDSAFRMRCEELTGQTDYMDRMRRQRWFQDVFVGNEIPIVNQIDLLSVTTTMEAGVDIGSLLAVMMANMPPRRFNYQQRVGRAGRRGSGVALALTFCRGRSHDDYYYQRPEMVTGDPPPLPYVDMNNENIIRRVIIKEVLRLVFREVNNKCTNGQRDSVHGEFGYCENWHLVREQVKDWLNDQSHENMIRALIDSLTVGTAWSQPSQIREQFKVEMIDFLREKLIGCIDEVVDSSYLTQEFLSERLANAGFLPMFGFPTRVRNMYTKWPKSGNPWPPNSGVIDRDLEIAISQFAPDTEIVKDKAVHTACGVVELAPQGSRLISKPGFVPALEHGNPSPIGICECCQAVVYLHSTDRPAPGGVLPEIQDCPVCQNHAMRCLDAREPKGFISTLAPKDFEGSFDWTPRSSRPFLGIKDINAQQSQVNNTRIARFADEIISINDDGGKGGFDFQKAKVYGKTHPGVYAVDNDGQFVTVGGLSYRIALLARRHTDILLVDFGSWPQGVFANPTTVEGRAAWYSFAFTLRMASAALLDIDTSELDAGFRVTNKNGIPAGSAFLCDKLENGAGYSSWLGQEKNFRNLLEQITTDDPTSIYSRWLNKEHSHTCDTSCNLCLRDFYNSMYHGLLDWRLGLDMIRVASDQNINVDLTSNWGHQENPWQHVIEGTSSRIAITMKNLGYKTPVNVEGQTVYIHNKRPQILIERHPLWTDEHPVYQNIVKLVREEYPKHMINPMNPFVAIRRPADYV
jgi:DEAD/DEAH box helicase domain-containing protein